MSRPITPEDLWSMARVGQPVPAPDGSFAIAPVTRYDDAGEAKTVLYRIDPSGGATPLTDPSRSSTAPAVSPDGTGLAFLRKADADAKPQLHLMRLDGGEAEPAATFPLGVLGVRWLPDGSGLIALVPLLRGFGSIAATEEERARRKEHEHLPVVTEDRIYRFWQKWIADGEVHHLFRIGTDGSVDDLTPEFVSIVDYEPSIESVAVSPDGTTVVFSALVDLSADRYQSALFAVPVAGGAVTRITDEPMAHEHRPRFSPDGSTLLYGRQEEWDFYADPMQLMLRDTATGATTRLAAGWDRSAAGWEFDGERSIVIGAENLGRSRLFRLDLDDPSDPDPIERPHSVHGGRPAAGHLWAREESLSMPPRVVELTSGVSVGFDDELLADLELGEVESIEFAGAGGDPVQAYVVYPPRFDRDERWPLVHNIHGGPHGVTSDTWHWRWNCHVFAAGGHIVAAVNFHGSLGWGDAFTRSIRGAWGDKPAEDILLATDHLVRGGFVDEERMAIAGGSYGGYLVSWLTGVTDRFAAAVCHAGVTDLIGQWASDVTAGREKSVGGVPWESMADIEEWSPIAHTHDMATPTLIVHGERDYRVVVTQGLVLYGVLKHKGIPARLVYYPDEGHWIEKRRNSLHWYAEVLDWFDRWLH